MNHVTEIFGESMVFDDATMKETRATLLKALKKTIEIGKSLRSGRR